MIQLFNKNRRLALYLLVFNVLFLPTLALAQNQADGFVGLVQLPGLDKPNEIDLQSYIDALIRISIIIAALIAVIKLIMAGARYVLSSVVTEKANAKGDIYSALIGLLIIIGAITILREINPNLVGLPVLENAPSFNNTGDTNSADNDKIAGLKCPPGSKATIQGSSTEPFCQTHSERDASVLLTKNNTEFNTLPIDHRTFLDTIDSNLDRNNELKNTPLEDFVGYLELDLSTREGNLFLLEFDYDQGKLEEFLETKCGSGNKLISVKRSFNTTGYYCAKN